MENQQIPFELQLMRVQMLLPEIADHITLILVIKGTVFTHMNDNSYWLSPDDMMLFNVYDRYSLASEDESVVLMPKISREKLSGYLGTPCAERFLCNTKMPGVHVAEYQKLREILLRVMQAKLRPSAVSHAEIHQYFYSLFAYLQKKFRVDTAGHEDICQGMDERIYRITQYIKKNHGQSLSLEALAKREFMSYSHLSRVFRVQMGMTFTEYVKRVRMTHALQELRNTNRSITKIALDNGFGSAKVFYHLFKQNYGMTPNEYRKYYIQNIPLSRKKEQSKYCVLEGRAALQEFSHYLMENDISEDSISLETHISLTLSEASTQPKPHCKKIIHIGTIAHGLEKSVQRELHIIQQELHFDIVSFTGFDIDNIQEESTIYSRRYLFLTTFFDEMRSLNLIPMIQIAIKPHLLSSVAEGYSFCDAQIAILRGLCNHYGTAHVGQWMIEWKGWKYSQYPKENDALYAYFFEQAKTIVPDIQIRILILTSLKQEDRKAMKQQLKTQIEINRLPDFYTIQANNEEKGDADNDGNPRFGNYAMQVYEAAKQVLLELSSTQEYNTNQMAPIYLTDWNTLSGGSGVVAGTFYRAAIITENILALMRSNVAGIGYWLNMETKKKLDQGDEGVLSLFFLHGIRRPVYFCIALIEKLGHTFLDIGEGYILTKACK